MAKYVEKRKLQQKTETKKVMGANGERKVNTGDHSYMYITPRTLLGIIRLSQALAKLNFRDEVSQKDVDESLRLMDFSFQSLRNNNVGSKAAQK